jgi:hypothetical protein
MRSRLRNHGACAVVLRVGTRRCSRDHSDHTACATTPPARPHRLRDNTACATTPPAPLPRPRLFLARASSSPARWPALWRSRQGRSALPGKEGLRCGSAGAVETQALWKRRRCGNAGAVEAQALWKRRRCGNAGAVETQALWKRRRCGNAGAVETQALWKRRRCGSAGAAEPRSPPCGSAFTIPWKRASTAPALPYSPTRVAARAPASTLSIGLRSLTPPSAPPMRERESGPL